MSTRAVYTFIDDDGDQFHIYKHYDGYPQSALKFIKKAIPYAYNYDSPSSRFEASDFAAAFVAGNKERSSNKSSRGGDVYLTNHYKEHGDLSYRYEITCKDRKLWVKIIDIEVGSPPRVLVIQGYLTDLLKGYKELCS
jgi:hypothetical protein